MAREQGISLVNLLVSLALSASLLLLLSQLLQQAFHSQRALQQRVLLQEDAQLSLQVLAQELRLAGFSANTQPVTIPLDHCNESKDWILDLQMGVDTNSSENLSVLGVNLRECLNIVAREGTDVLFIRRLAASPQQVGQSFAKSWYLLKKGQLSESYFIYLEHWPADLLGAGDSLWKLESKAFYVRDYSRLGDTIPSLVMVSSNTTGFDHQVLVEHVEALQLQWLIQQEEGSFYLKRHINAEELNRSVLLRLHLLMRAGKAGESQAISSIELAENYPLEHPEFSYQYFVSSVYLRNHVGENL